MGEKVTHTLYVNDTIIVEFQFFKGNKIGDKITVFD